MTWNYPNKNSSRRCTVSQIRAATGATDSIANNCKKIKAYLKIKTPPVGDTALQVRAAGGATNSIANKNR